MSAPNKPLKKPVLQKILKKNPQIDMEQLKEVSVLISQLREDGLAKPTYRLESPYMSLSSSHD